MPLFTRHFLSYYLEQVHYKLLLSGGVDSSTALAELASAGHDVSAYYLKVWLEDELSYLGACPWEADLEYARAVCSQYHVPLTVVPLQLQYHEAVVSYTLSELKRGRTPSPDIFCNERIKFGAFLDYLLSSGQLGADDRIASGHYARIDRSGGQVLLKRSPDQVKDQTYFLSHLSRQQLARLEFPIGAWTKAELRRRAAELDIPARDRKESQGICFLGKIRYPEFVRHYLGEQPGEIVELESGRRLGDHRGYWFHTIGQRQGLGLSGGPWYVVKKEMETNTVFVSHAEHVDRQGRRSLLISDLHWTGRPTALKRVQVKLRHGPAMHPARLSWTGEDEMSVELDEPDRGIAPGQFVVLYNGEVCLGAGSIKGE